MATSTKAKTKTKAKATVKSFGALKRTAEKLVDIANEVDPVMEAIEAYAKVNPEFKVAKRTRDRCIKLFKQLNDASGQTLFSGITVDVIMETGSRSVLDTDRLKRDLGAKYDTYLVDVPSREFSVIPKRA